MVSIMSIQSLKSSSVTAGLALVVVARPFQHAIMWYAYIFPSSFDLSDGDVQPLRPTAYRGKGQSSFLPLLDSQTELLVTGDTKTADLVYRARAVFRRCYLVVGGFGEKTS
jgi:hypothetical protein